MRKLRLNLERFASHGMRALGALLGEASPHYFVLEFPKSGGTWLAEMIADYLGIPRPDRAIFPVLGRAVIHGHWPYTPRLHRVFYLVRDVRDVAISGYFRWLWEVRHPPYPQTVPYYKRRMPVLFRPDADDIRACLPQFIHELAAAPPGSRLGWSQHVLAWRNAPQVASLRYEDLLRDPFRELEKALQHHTGAPIDRCRLEEAVAMNSFERRTGRRPGQADATSFLRKGVAGDWRNHTSRAAGAVFEEHFGDVLRLVGYETKRNWWRELPE